MYSKKLQNATSVKLNIAYGKRPTQDASLNLDEITEEVQCKVCKVNDGKLRNRASDMFTAAELAFLYHSYSTSPSLVKLILNWVFLNDTCMP